MERSSAYFYIKNKGKKHEHHENWNRIFFLQLIINVCYIILVAHVRNRAPLKITLFFLIQSACDGMHERGNNFPFHYPIMVFPVLLDFLELVIYIANYA